jgi:hypothetical protein
MLLKLGSANMARRVVIIGYGPFLALELWNPISTWSIPCTSTLTAP